MLEMRTAKQMNLVKHATIPSVKNQIKKREFILSKKLLLCPVLFNYKAKLIIVYKYINKKYDLYIAEIVGKMIRPFI
jgi:hypothetical protein